MAESGVETIATTWQIDPAHTMVEFIVKHLMISNVKGRFGGVQGTLQLADENYQTARVELTIDAVSIDTREAQRDVHLRSPDFLDADTFPALTFASRRIEGVAGRSFQLVGDLTIRGVTREVMLDVTDLGRQRDPWGAERAAFSATTAINRKDFGLVWNQALETGGVLVGDEVRITIDAELIKQS